MTPQNANDTLRAGAARVDITPDPGIQLAGDIGRYRPVEEIRDRLYANALVLEAGGDRVALLSADLLAMGCDWSDRIRFEAAEKLGMAPESVIVHVVQNHASPSLGHLFVSSCSTHFPPEYPWLSGGDDRYHEPTATRCVEALVLAAKRLEPVCMEATRGIDGRVAFNRRFVMRDGTARTHPPCCDPNILHAEGPADPEVGIATFTNAAGEVVSALLHHTCHPCHGYPHRYVIGDWPGAWVERMRDHWGAHCVPLVINGCCGNVHHSNHMAPGKQPDYREMAAMLTETTLNALPSATPMNVSSIDTRQIKLRLPLRKPTAEEVARAARMLKTYPQPKWKDETCTSVDWDWVYAVMILDLKDTCDRAPHFDYEIQVLRLGDFALATLMGEPFVEGQLQIKQASPAPYTFVAHFCNGYAGYVPTRRAFLGGGYETRTSNGSKFMPDALERITDAAIALLHNEGI